MSTPISHLPKSVVQLPSSSTQQSPHHQQQHADADADETLKEVLEEIAKESKNVTIAAAAPPNPVVMTSSSSSSPLVPPRGDGAMMLPSPRIASQSSSSSLYPAAVATQPAAVGMPLLLKKTVIAFLFVLLAMMLPVGDVLSSYVPNSSMVNGRVPWLWEVTVAALSAIAITLLTPLLV